MRKNNARFQGHRRNQSIEKLERRSLLSAALAGNLVQDGGFESPVPASGDYQQFVVGQSLGPWAVIGTGTLDTLQSGFSQLGFTFQAGEGSQSVDLTGFTNQAAGLQQAIATTAGSNYSMTFEVGNTVDSNDTFGSTSTVNVLINGAQVRAVTNSASSGSNVNWQTFTVPFTASGASTTLAFINGDGAGDNYCGLDSVVVSSGVELAFSQQPTTAQISETIKPPVSVQIMDAAGALDTSSTDAITLALAGGSGTLGGTTTLNAVAGVATFSNLTIDKAGTYTLTATDADRSTADATSDQFKVNADSLKIRLQPQNGDAGQALKTVEVDLLDPTGKIDTANNSSIVTLNPTGTAASSPIAGNTVTAVNGIATFGALTLARAGKYQLQPALDGTNSGPATKSFSVFGDHLRVVVQPQNAGEGEHVVFSVEVDDHDNKPDITADGDSLQLVVTTKATLGNVPYSSTLNVVGISGARGLFTSTTGPTFSAAGQYSLSVYRVTPDSSGNFSQDDTTKPVLTHKFKVLADQLKLIMPPGDTQLGDRVALTIGRYDLNGQLDTDPTSDIVTLKIKTLQIATGQNKNQTISTTSASFVSGVATYDSTNGPLISAAGIYTLTASEAKSTSSPIATTAATPVTSAKFRILGDHLVVKLQPKTTGVNAPVLFTVGAYDISNQLDTDVNGDVALLKLNTVATAPGGSGSAINSLKTAVFSNGIATFDESVGPTIGVAGTYTFSVFRENSDTGSLALDLTTLGTRTNSFKVLDDHLVFAGVPATAITGDRIAFSVTAFDFNGQTDTYLNATLVLKIVTLSNTGTGNSVNSSQSIAIVNGVATYDSTNGPSIGAPGVYQISASVAQFLAGSGTPLPSSVAPPVTSPKINVTVPVGI